jgi:predicted amidohydrolase YtcJ
VESFLLQYVQLFRCISIISSLAPAAKDDLDREPLLRGRLILLARIDFHAYWVSNAILSKLTDLPDVVDGGLIIRHEDGKPTGPSSLSLRLPK